MADIPKVIKNFNAFLDGRGFAGKVDSVTLPTLSLVTEESRSGGMDAPIDLDMGMEKLTLSMTFAEQSKDVLKSFGLFNQNGVSITLRAAMADDTTVTPYIVKATGMFTSVDSGSLENGSKNTLTVEASLRFYQLHIGPEEIYHIDVMNMVRRIGGIDQLAQERAALGL